MAGDIDKTGSNASGEIITLGDYDSNVRVSMQVLQAVYNELTGKTEEISTDYDLNFMLVLDDLKQLNHKILQASEQYQVKLLNCSVTLYYELDKRETFSSFERFLLYNQSNLKPLQSVTFVYNLLIIPPKTSKPQPYELTIKLASGVVVFAKYREEVPSLLWDVLKKRNATVTVKYIDYLVAKTFIDLVDDWLRGLQQTHPPSMIRFLRKLAPFIPKVSKYGLFILTVVLSLRLIPNYVSPPIADLALFGKTMTLVYSALFCSYRIGMYFGDNIQEAINGYFDLTYIKLTRGDELKIEEFCNDNRKKLFKVLWNTLGIIALGTISSLLAAWLISVAT